MTSEEALKSSLTSDDVEKDEGLPFERPVEIIQC